MLHFKPAAAEHTVHNLAEKILTQDHYTTYLLGMVTGAGAKEILAGDYVGGGIMMGIGMLGATASLVRNIGRMRTLHPAPGA